MHYKFKELTIDRENPFQADRLGRKKYAQILTNIIAHNHDGYVVVTP